MRDVDSTYKTGAKQKIRDVAVKIETNAAEAKTINAETNAAEAKTINADKIISATIQRSLTDGSFTIGNTPSDRLNAVVIDTDKLPKKTRVTISVAFNNSAYENIGRFYVDKCTRNGQRVSITAFDYLSLAETEVKFGGKASKNLEKLNFPCTMQQMLDYIVTLKGMTCEFECQPFTVTKKPMKSETEYYTARELFGFIAGCHGCNAKIGYDGKLTFKEFGEVSAAFTADNVLDMSVDDFEPFTVKGVLFSVGDDSIYIDDTPGSEYDAEADGIVQTNNPFATVEVAEYVWNKIGKLSYYGGSIKIRGEGILEPGDVVTVKNLKYPTDTTEYPVLITDISYSITRDGGFIETLSSAVSRKSSSNGGASNAVKSGSGISDQVRITSGKAYYNGETYRLQRGNNRRVIAVSKGANFCTLIDTDPYGTEAESEIAAATAILKGLEQRATVEFTFTNKTEGYSISAPARFDNEEDASIDWGDGTVESNLATNHQFAIGTFTVKISAPNAKKITSFYTYLDGDNDNTIYIGGEVDEINNCSAYYCGKVVFGESVKKLLKTSFGDDKLIDFAVPPCAQEFEVSGDIICNTIYIPDTCVKLGSTSGYKRLTNVEICPEGNNLVLDHSCDIFVGRSGSSQGLYAIRSLSLPSRCQTFGTTQQQFCWNQNVQFFRFERGCTAIPPSFLSSSLSVGSRVYVPKTITSIGTDALRASTVLFEGTQSEWNAITTNPNWNSGANCIVKCGADFYNAYENDINRDWGAENLGAGSGIDITSGTVSVKCIPGKGVYSGQDGLYLGEASTSLIGGIRLGKGLATSGGYSNKKTDVNLGNGLTFDDNGKILPLLWSGLKFDKIPIEDDENGATQNVIALNIGAGLKFDSDNALAVDANAVGGNYTAGAGIKITGNEIALTPAGTQIGGVKAGKNVTISADGTLDVTAVGADYSAGGGIEITEGEEGEKPTIGVKCGEGCEINENSELVTVPNIQSAVIIAAADAKYLLHNYTQTEYIAGNKIGYAGAQNQIIINGYIAVKAGNQLSAPLYQSATLTSVSGTTTAEHVITAELVSAASAGAYRFTVSDNGVVRGTYTTYDPATIGFAITWGAIYPATQAAPHGYAYLEFHAICKPTAASETNSATFIPNTSRINYNFASEAEYNAAVGLTYEPITLTQVTDSTTVV